MIAVLAFGASAEALPYMPDTVEWRVLTTRFKETGTDTACIHCDDADPTNDLTLRVAFGGEAAEMDLAMRLGSWGYEGDVLIHIRCGPGDPSVPPRADPNRRLNPSEYPKPSVAYGWLEGWLLW